MRNETIKFGSASSRAREVRARDLDGDAAVPFDDVLRADTPAQDRAEEELERRKKHAIAVDDLDLD